MSENRSPEDWADDIREMVAEHPNEEEIGVALVNMTDGWDSERRNRIDAEALARAWESDVDALTLELNECLDGKDEFTQRIAFDAKGKIMDGEDPKTVLEWVLTQVSREEIVL